MIEYFSYYQVKDTNSGRTTTGLTEAEAKRMKDANNNLIMVGPFTGTRSSK